MFGTDHARRAFEGRILDDNGGQGIYGNGKRHIDKEFYACARPVDGVIVFQGFMNYAHRREGRQSLVVLFA